MKYFIGIIIALLALAGGWYFFSTNTTESNPAAQTGSQTDTFSIATSFYPLEFIANEITGGLANVTNVGAGQDPHDFQPNTQDVLALMSADLVILQGADFEPWGEKIEKQLRANNTPVFIATQDIALHEYKDAHDDHGEEEHADEHDSHEEDEHGHDDHGDEHADEHDGHEEKGLDDHGDEHDEHNHGSFDPHVWLDAVLLSDIVEHLTEAIVKLDPQNQASYEANAKNLQLKLTTLHEEYTNKLANCTLDEAITSHDAFGYVAERYNIEIHAITGLSTQDTPSATMLASLKEEAEEGVGAILLEKNNIAAYGETLARETGLQTLDIHPIAYVTLDEDYFSLMRSNLNSFATALQCNE